MLEVVGKFRAGGVFTRNHVKASPVLCFGGTTLEIFKSMVVPRQGLSLKLEFISVRKLIFSESGT